MSLEQNVSEARRDDALPHELILSIQRILDIQHDSDPLDDLSDDFNPVNTLNGIFPNEESLGQLETVQAHLAQNELQLQQEIKSLQDELRKEQDPSRMQSIQEMISDLLGQMSRIREKATESEAVVRNITKEIQMLDLAKKNLILSMTTLKRLQMLVNALGQLEEQVTENKYSEIAQTLAAVKQISNSFRPYNAVQRISQIWRRVQEIQSELRTKIDADWDKFYAQDPTKPIKASTMAAACRVVDVLGPEIRTQFVERYVALELKEYRRIFKATDEAGQLDNIATRFAWFRRSLQTHETETGRVFPGDWQVGWYLTAKFVEITRDDLTVLLSKAGSNLTIKQLLESLQEVLEFESSMVKKYATPLSDILKTTQANNATRTSRTISSAFEPHMGVFIQAQDKALQGMLSQYRGLKSRSSLEAATPRTSEDSEQPQSAVLPSSTELFYFYAQNLEQCAKLFTGQPLFDLCQLHRKWLRIYAEEVLVASMKRPTFQIRRSTDTRVDVSELRNASVLINTADYCHTTALELEDKIREKIDEGFKSRISFQEECDLFVSAISSAILVLLKELENACEPAFNTMSRTMWSSLDLVSGPSPYVDEIVKSVEQVTDVIKPLIEQKKYVRNYLDKAAGLVIAKFTNAFVKSRPVKEIGAEQLLLDLQVVKACLLRLPGEAEPPQSYTRSVNNHTQRLEKLLKVIVTPADPPEVFILSYTALICDLSFSNFQKILDLKGTPKAQQSELQDTFLTVTSTKPELENTSFLSSLDMDPGQTSSVGSPGGSRVNLLSGVGGDGILSALASPTPGVATQGDTSRAEPVSKFTDLRRFVSFAVRRDTVM
ncbi:Vps53-like protein [Irpex rosettiformis]|uniref:Vps53-like protein n=1 Tax=Irpex rosettiformis TaxID=378272 RepID=A0ACB8TSV0_9APHY|nr:Vps53-like protein [Irpex rosettiformis]